MSRWLRCTRVWCVAQPRKFHKRLYSTPSSVEHVRVPCASAGSITVSLHNINRHDATTPLVILIPPFSHPNSDHTVPVPPCFQDYPAAVINYRWEAPEGHERPEIPLHWPTPLHDVSFGYSWLMDNLGSGAENSADPRPAYVYGSYLGASLAAGLALTESHAPDRSRPMTIRGLIAHNGIYNWTMFLPDHPIHKLRLKSSSKRKKRGLPFTTTADDSPIPFEEEGILTALKHDAPGLFSSPANLFDPFASACLFFHSANLHVPDDFTTPLSAHAALSTEFTAAVDALATSQPASETSSKTEEQEEESADSLLTKAATLAKQLKPPRKGYLVFPPRRSTLRIPRTLFLHDRPRDGNDYYPNPYPSPPPSPSPPSSGTTTGTTTAAAAATATATTTRRNRQGLHGGTNSSSKNNFAHQATELAGLMLRSLDMHELRGRPAAAPWEWEAEAGGAGGGGEEEGYVALSRGDEDDARVRELGRRVQSFEVDARARSRSSGSGTRAGGMGLDERGGEVVGEWLRERVDEDFGGEEFGG